LVVSEDGEKMLVAYYVGKIHDLNKFRSRMEQVLPEYMVPAHFISLNAMPFNKNGKINRAELPHPSEKIKTRDQFVAPRNETERVLTGIWEKVLKRWGLGIDANFFELGGHSLKATQLAYYIAQDLKVDIQLRDIFATPTVREIAEIIDRSERSVYENITPVEEQEYYDVSHAQKRLWIHHQYGDGSEVYIVPCMYRFKGNLNVAALEQSFKTLIQRHESLRTIFPTIEGKPKQLIRRDGADAFKISIVDGRHLSGEEELQQAVKEQRGQIEFDLEKGPLLIAKLLRLKDDEQVLMFFMHHIVSDGWSMGVLMQEITLLHEHFNEGKALSLPPLHIQYKDYSAWHNQQLDDDTMNDHQRFWYQKFSGELPVLELPTDFDRPEYKTYQGSTLEFTIQEEFGQQVIELINREQASLFIFLEAAIKILLYKYTGQKDITLGTPIAGREHADLENQIGFYLNTLALRTKVDSAKTFHHLLTQTKKETLEAFAHQLYPFDKLVDELGIDTTGSRSPLFDVMLVLQNMDLERKGGALKDVRVTGFHDAEQAVASKYDLTFFFKQYDKVISGTIAYSTALFAGQSIIRLKDDLLHIIKQVTQNPTLVLGDLTLMSESPSKDERLNAFID
ncbi:MAG: condensation domain-containing protein, partial [Bacteroidota bacterium]